MRIITSRPVFWFFEIETHSNCTRRCPTCLRECTPDADHSIHILRKAGKATRMDTAVVRSVIDQLAAMDFRGVLFFQHYNEPLLDDRIASFGTYAKNRLQARSVEIITNGDLLTEARAKELDGTLDKITCSLYHPPETHEAIKSKTRSWFRKTEIEFTDGRHTISHNSPFRNRHDQIQLVIGTPCTFYHNRFIVACDGTALFCCQDYSGHFDLGNVHQDSVSDIWHSNQYRQLEANLSQPGGRSKQEYCRSCPI